MHVLVVGKIHSEVTEACKIAMSRGAKITNAESIDEGFNKVLNGEGGDLILVDVEDDIVTYTYRKHDKDNDDRGYVRTGKENNCVLVRGGKSASSKPWSESEKEEKVRKRRK